MQYPIGSSGAGVIGVLSFLVSAFLMIFCLVVAWRAMRAHEEIAAALRERRNPPA